MKVFTTFFLIFLANACAHTPGLKMLKIRSSYLDPSDPKTKDPSIYYDEAEYVRTGAVVKRAWLYPKRISERAHFAGGWIDYVVIEDQWQSRGHSRSNSAK